MAKDRSTIRSELRSDLRIDPNGKVWSDDVLNQLIHEGEIEVARRDITITELETDTTFTTVIGDRSYDLPTDLLRIINVIYDASTQVTQTGATLSFSDTDPDTILDSASGFSTTGFLSGMKLQVVNSTSNDGEGLEVDTVAAGTLTLTTASSVTTESAGETLTLVGATDPDHQTLLERVEDIRTIERGGFANLLGYPTRYAVLSNDLYFDVLPKETDLTRVRYVKLPALMAADGTNSDIPDELIPLVRLWAKYLSYDQEIEAAASQTALGRFEREIRRKITMRGLNDYALRKYGGKSWRGNWKSHIT